MDRKEQIEKVVLQLIEEFTKDAKRSLIHILQRATDEQLAEPHAINDIYTMLFEDAARQLSPKSPWASNKEIRRHKKAVVSFFYLSR